mgnify:CR=1 FL=1
MINCVVLNTSRGDEVTLNDSTKLASPLRRNSMLPVPATIDSSKVATRSASANTFEALLAGRVFAKVGGVVSPAAEIT